MDAATERASERASEGTRERRYEEERSRAGRRRMSGWSDDTKK
tara:strand:+ start:1111 stop:1239 length:129 start_codon:yes stop_codon:yes gene_type:complete